MIGTNLLVRFFAPLAVGLLIATVSLSGVASADVIALQEPDAFDYNGTRVDISGNTAVVGGCCGGENGKGWVQVFVYTDTGGSWAWQHQQTITADDATMPANARFGYGLGIDGNRLVVGAFNHDTVYSFDRAGVVWTEAASGRLTVPGADGFGYDVGIDQDRVIVGAQPDDTAFIFDTAEQTDQGLSCSGARAEYGYTVDVSGDRAIVGDPAANAAYLYRCELQGDPEHWVWFEEAALAPAGNDQFGVSVAIDGDYCIVGADATDLGGQYDAGSAVIYHHDGTEWTDPVTLAPDELAIGDHFGASVAICGDVAVVGAINQGALGARTGSVYVFERVDDAWVQSAKLQPPDGADGDQFGNSVAIDDDWIVVGAWYHDSDTGAAYVFPTPSLERIPGDADFDGQVDEDDVAILAQYWGTDTGMGWTNGDFDGDGAVGMKDASILAANWHAGVSEQTTAVPEPAAATLLAAMLLLLAARRQR